MQRLFLVLCLGVAAGWWIHGLVPRPDTFSPPTVTGPDRALQQPQDNPIDVDEPTDFNTMIDQLGRSEGQERRQLWNLMVSALAQAVERHDCPAVDAAIAYYIEKHPVEAWTEYLLSECQWVNGDHQDAVFRLIDGLLLTENRSEQVQFRKQLDAWIADYSSKMEREGQLSMLDIFYQNILVRLPNEANYYMELARIRVQQGDLQRAIGTLMQIQLDREQGYAARRMITDLENQQSEVRYGSPRIPLTVSGSRLLVQATLDGVESVQLLLDTGAAMSMLDPDLLRGRGYHNGGSQQRRFNTVNGFVDVPVFRVNSLDVAGNLQANLQIAAARIGAGPEVDGLLGMNFLQHYQFIIDQDEQVLYLLPRPAG